MKKLKLTRTEVRGLQGPPAYVKALVAHFYLLASLEPKIPKLLEICRQLRKEHERCKKHFNDYFYWNTYIRPILKSFVGWFVKNKPETPPIFRTKEAYDAVFAVLQAAMPDCLCRHCNDEEREDWETDWGCGHALDEDHPRYFKCPHRSQFEEPMVLPWPEWGLARFKPGWANGFVYFIESGALIKIGWSGNVEKRLASLQGSSALPMKLLGYVRGTRAYERALHDKFRHLHHHLEWFNRDEELLLAIEEICGESVDKEQASA